MSKKYQLKQILSNLEISIGMIGVEYPKDEDMTDDLVNFDINWAIKTLEWNLNQLKELKDE